MPLFLIDKYIKKFLDKLKLCLQSKKQLTEFFCTYLKNIKLNVAIRSYNGIRDTFRFKDQISKHMNSKVIHNFKCNICNDVYIAETERHFLVREYEHLRKPVLTEKNLKYNEKDATAIRKHCHNYGHTASTSCFSLVQNAANKYHLKLKESLLIWKNETIAQLAKESMPLHFLENDS